LHARSGGFTAATSALSGMLRPHSANPRAWMTDDGRTFLNLSDTAYRLFHGIDAPLWREYVRDAAAKGINCLRVAALGGWGGTLDAKVDNNDNWTWNDPWAGGANPDHTRFDLGKFQTTDARLAWLLDHHPGVQVQMILFGLKGYRSPQTGRQWLALPEAVRRETMQTMIARWAAFPNVFWLIVNDMHGDAGFPENQAFVREVGSFFAAHDPWRHLLSSGPQRNGGFPFTTPDDLRWCTYLHVESGNAVGADLIRQQGFDRLPLHVWMAEDYYEQDRGAFPDAAYFYRWLFWSWALSGGSANYGGRFGPIHPYTMTHRPDLAWMGGDRKTDYAGKQLVGLDSLPAMTRFLRERGLDLAHFEACDERVADSDGRTGKLRPKAMRRGHEEFLVYHPNASPARLPGKAAPAAAGSDRAAAQSARLHPSLCARLTIDLRETAERYQATWMRAADGVIAEGGWVEGGAERALTAPWVGADVVLHLRRAP
jgi:hypothetical protein